MNFYRTELKKIMEGSTVLTDQKYIGQTCYGTICGNLRARVEFMKSSRNDDYVGIKVSIIDRQEGMIDSVSLRFLDVWGKQRTNDPNFKGGIVPCIHNDSVTGDWSVFRPADADYHKIAGEVEDYLSLFQNMAVEQIGQKSGMQHADR